jgi:hypothetical protein
MTLSAEQPYQVAAGDQAVLIGREAEEVHFVQLEPGMQPGSIGSEEHLVGAGAPHSLEQEIEAPDPCRVRVDVVMSYQLIDQSAVSAPVVRETAEMRDDEVDIGILGREQFDDGDLTHDVIENRNTMSAGSEADLAGDPRVVLMNLDAATVQLGNRFVHHSANATGVAHWVHHREGEKALRCPRDDLGDLAICGRVV